ncbi:MAG: hypothetical protein OQK11_08255 [Thiovulaceae bacterium]|nr:hypothetical protein [Sulfurimonadaceae bacterium]
MKKLFLSIIVISMAVLTFSGCAAKEKKVDEPYYDRANQAAEKAHNKLDKE